MYYWLSKANDWAIDNIPQEKLLHFIIGGASFSVVYIVLNLCNCNSVSLIFGILTSILVGTGKELCDKYFRKKLCDKGNMVATILGGIVQLVFVAITMIWQ